MFRYIIWDFDGTLVDPYPEIARTINQALATFDKTASLERVIELSSISLDFCITELSKELVIPYENLNKQFAVYYETINQEKQSPFPYVVDVCKRIQELGGQNFIVTHRRKKSLHELLTLHDLYFYFTDIVAGDDGFPRKPDSSAMLYLLEKYQLPLDKSLVIGDRPLDILAGQSAGLKTCLFQDSFPKIRPDLSISSYEQVLKYL